MSTLGVAAGRTRRRLAGAGRLAGVRVKGTPIEPSRRAAVVLASEGRPFSAAAVDSALARAAAVQGSVLVLSIARLHGTSLGFPNPGLAPTRAEWETQREIVGRTVARLKRRGVDAEGQVLGTRSPAKRICAIAYAVGAEVIVMGADVDRGGLLRGMLWSQEPQVVARRAKLPVDLVYG